MCMYQSGNKKFNIKILNQSSKLLEASVINYFRSKINSQKNAVKPL